LFAKSAPMKILRTLLLILVVLFVIYVIWMFTLPGNYNVSRSVVVKTSPQHAFSYVSDFKNWPDWMAWFEDDTTMEASFGEQTTGVGGNYRWESEESGSGAQEFTKVEPPKTLETSIKFEGMMSSESQGYWQFRPTDDGKTSITWGFKGDLPFLMRSFGLIMESQVGRSFERGLANIKKFLEEKSNPVNVIQEAEVSSLPYFGQKKAFRISELDSLDYARHYENVARYLGRDMQQVLGQPRAIFHNWQPGEDSTVVEFVIPVQSDKPGNDSIRTGNTYLGPVVMMTFQGPYGKLSYAHDTLIRYINAHNYTIVEAPWETYLSDPAHVTDPNLYQTEVVYPVGKLE